MLWLNPYKQALYVRDTVTTFPRMDNRMFHFEQQINRKKETIIMYLLRMLVAEHYGCPMSPEMFFVGAKIRRKLSSARLCATGANREDSNLGPRSCPCRRSILRSRLSPPPDDRTSRRTQAALLPRGVQ